jgi:Holliday junction resolvase
MRRIPRRRDANEGDIIDAFTALGWSVQRISAKGAPDLVCAKGQRVVFVEVKTAKGKLTEDQVTWHANWRGPKPVIVRRVEDVGSV